MGAGKVIIRPKGPVAVTVHQTVPQNIVHRFMIPGSHGAKIGEPAGGAIHSSVTGPFRAVWKGREGRLYRYGAAGHGEGVFASALGRQLDPVPLAAGDGQSIQPAAAVRGGGQGDGAAAAGSGAVGGHFAMLRLLHRNGVGAGVPAAARGVRGVRGLRGF